MNHDNELDIMNTPVTTTDGVADASEATPNASDATPDANDVTPLGRAGAVTRALAADDTDNDG